MLAAVRRTGGVFTRKREGTSLRESTTVQAMPRPERLELSKPSVKADLLLVAATAAVACCSMCGNKRRNSRSAASQLPVGCRPILNTCPLDASHFLLCDFDFFKLEWRTTGKL